MQTSDEIGRRVTAATTQAPTLDERMGAVEDFLQQLLVLLEVEPELTRENIGAWMELCSASARAHGLQSTRQALAMEHLRTHVLGPSLDIERATPDE